ncbi:MAG TPA: hypothetical protein VFT04_12810, partial [Gemmatimonadales bacterium]|nr:hypothetical protein [Gemmatimonadales bacterium]
MPRLDGARPAYVTAPGSTPDPPLTSIGGEPLDPSVDLVRVAARGLAAGVLAGIGAAAVVLAIVRFLLRNAAPSDMPDTGAAFFVLVFGTLGAMGLGGAVAWRGLAPVRSPYRRGIFSLIAGFATFVGALLATPVHYFLGTPGLLALAGACLLSASA